jgi:hypothetical protein
MKLRTFFFLGVTLSASLLPGWFTAIPAVPGEGVRAPVEQAGFQSLTKYPAMTSYLRELCSAAGWRLDTIAVSSSGRPVVMVHVVPAGTPAQSRSPLRVLLSAQQHGDEPSGKEALLVLLAGIARNQYAGSFDSLELWIVPQMNPDGGEAEHRLTAEGIDLNRSHLVLNSPETRGLHRLYAEVMPDVSLDIHEYGAYSKSWSDSGFVKAGDVQLGMLTNLNCPANVMRYQHEHVYPAVRAAMDEQGFLFHEYIVGSPSSRIRHSTTETNDGRQSLGVQGSLSFIQEGRQGKSLTANLERRVKSQLAAVEALLRYCNGHAGEIRGVVRDARAGLCAMSGKRFVTVMDHFPSKAILTIPVEDLRSGSVVRRDVGPYHSVVEPLGETVLPDGYVIPKRMTGLLEILTLHAVQMETVQVARSAAGEEFLIDSVGTAMVEEEPHPRPHGRLNPVAVTLSEGDVIVPLAQGRSMLVATLLEPESMWGISKYPEFASMFAPGRYPILRIKAVAK